MQSATGQYGTQAGEPAQPVQHSVMTASSLGFFFRGVVIPSDLGSLLIAVAVMFELWHTGVCFASSLDFVDVGILDEAVAYGVSPQSHSFDGCRLSESAAQFANQRILGTDSVDLRKVYAVGLGYCAPSGINLPVCGFDALRINHG